MLPVARSNETCQKLTQDQGHEAKGEGNDCSHLPKSAREISIYIVYLPYIMYVHTYMYVIAWFDLQDGACEII